MFSPLGEALKQRFVEDQYPVLWSSSSAVLYPVGYAFGPFPTYADQCGLFIDWLAETWKEKRAPRLAFATWDTTYGKAVLGPEVLAYAKSKGIEVVATELFGVRDVAVTNQVMRIRAKKADWIYTNTLAHGPALLAKAAKEMGYKVGFAGGMGFDNVCIKLGGEAVEGFVGIHGAAHFNETNSKGVQTILEYMKKNDRPEGYQTSTYPISWAAVIIFKEIMERVIDKYGWEKVYDGPTVKKELQGLKDFAVLEDLWHFSYEPKRPSPISGKVFQVKNGKIVPLTGFMTMPDLRPAAYK
jgi:branched-chain amino acid transport system substrate-binding protein